MNTIAVGTNHLISLPVWCVAQTLAPTAVPQGKGYFQGRVLFSQKDYFVTDRTPDLCFTRGLRMFINTPFFSSAFERIPASDMTSSAARQPFLLCIGQRCACLSSEHTREGKWSFITMFNVCKRWIWLPGVSSVKWFLFGK